MPLRFSFLLLLCSLSLNLILTSCKPEVSNSGKDQVLKDTFPAVTLPTVTEHPPIKAQGTLKNVEDSGYPFFTLTIEFPEKGFTNSFNLNAEEIKSIDAQTLVNSTGKLVSITYTSKSENALIDLTLEGTSLLTGGKPDKESKTLNKVTGILSQANEVTSGDLPGELMITDDHERSEKFSFYITPEIVRANGKVVVGYFEQRMQNNITALEIKS